MRYRRASFRDSTIPRIARGLGILLACFLAPAARAGTFYDFSWSFAPYSASGTMELSSSIDVGDSFHITDVLMIDVELFDGGVSVDRITSPPIVFNPPFDEIKGTRNATDLAMIDFLISNDHLFGCTAGDCLSGEVFFPTAPSGTVDFGSIQAARESFVFTQVPEPADVWALAAAGVALAGLRRTGLPPA